VEFEVLGLLRVRHGTQLLPLTAMMPRILLGILLARANSRVSAEALGDALWAGRADTRRAQKLQMLVHRLRRALGDPARITFEHSGYALRVHPGELDAERFETLLDEGTDAARSGESARGAELLRKALELWRGEPYADLVDVDLVRAEADRLTERWLAGLEELYDAELTAGRHTAVIPELIELARQHPLRERLPQLLMIALYRAGRQVEALDVYRRTRLVLVEELGLEPSPELRRLEHAILVADPALDLVPVAAPQPPIALPAQLPPDLPDFTAQETQLAVLHDQLAAANAPRAVVISTISGKGGVGKTALAVHLAHQLRDEFPDGQLYVNLRGTEPQALDPAAVLARFLRALGVDNAAIPDDLEERTAMYRSQLADRRMLVLLDNAASEAQVRPLFPGTAGSAVLITSRVRLAGLSGNWQVDLDVLGVDQAIELLARVVGADRVDVEPDAAVQIVRHCGQLPLAVRIAAARLAARPHWPLARLATRLADEHRRLDELRLGDLEVRASLTLSYLGLEPDEQRALRRLALLDAPDFAVWVVAVLLDIGLDQANDTMERLVDAQLLEIVGDDATGHHRYCFHDLIRLCARERAQAEESQAERAAAIERLVGAFLGLAERASRRLVGAVDWLEHGDALRWTIDPALVDRLLTAPARWFEAERLCLIAAVEQAAAWGLPEASWSLANSVGDFLELGEYRDECVHVHEVALGVATRSGHRLGEGVMQHNLAALYSIQGRYDESLRYLEHAQAAFREVGYRHGETRVCHTRGGILRFLGRSAEALDNFARALPTFRELDDRRGEAYTLTHIGALYLSEGRSTEAAECFKQSLAHYRDTGHRTGEAHALRYIGKLHVAQGQLDEAVRCLTQCLHLCHEMGDSVGGGYGLQALGEAYIKQGKRTEARIQLEQSLERFRETHHRYGEALCLGSLAELLDGESRFDEAIIRLDQALDIWRQLGLPLQQAGTLRSLAQMHAAGGDHQAARTAWREALATFRELDVLDSEEIPSGFGD